MLQWPVQKTLQNGHGACNLPQPSLTLTDGCFINSPGLFQLNAVVHDRRVVAASARVSVHYRSTWIIILSMTVCETDDSDTMEYMLQVSIRYLCLPTVASVTYISAHLTYR